MVCRSSHACFGEPVTDACFIEIGEHCPARRGDAFAAAIFASPDLRVTNIAHGRSTLEIAARCQLASSLGTEKDMFRMWYWAVVERDDSNPFVAYIPDLPDVRASGETEIEALERARLTAAECVRKLSGEDREIPLGRPAWEIKRGRGERARALVPVDVSDNAADHGP
jgi:predicted RNase H-like HicB family nuclease